MHSLINHRLWVAPTSLAYVLALALPILCLGAWGLRADEGNLEHMWGTVLGRYIGDTLALLPTVALLSATIGIGAAWMTTAYDFPGRRWLSILLATPFCIPPFIHGFVYSEAFDVGGSLHGWLAPLLGIDAGSWPSFRNLGGASIVFSLSLYPYIYLPARIVFLNIIRSYRTAAGALGAGEAKFFFHIALPLAAGSIVAGAALTGMDVISDYGLVEYYGVNTISIGILRAWYGLGDLGLTALLSVTTLVGVALLLALVYTLQKKWVLRSQLSTQQEYAPAPRLGRGATLLTSVLGWGLVSLVFILPLCMLLGWIVEGWAEIKLGRLLHVSLNTIFLSVACSLMLLIAALALCFAARIEPSKAWRNYFRGLRHGLSVSYALPGVVVAIGVVIAIEAANGWLGLGHSNLFTIVFGLIPLALAYQLRFSAVAINTIGPAMDQIPHETDDSARALGANNLSLLRRIFLPILANPIRTTLILLGINLIKELPMAVFLRPIGFDTLAVDSFIKILDERVVQAAPGALLIVVASFGLFLLLLRVFALDVRSSR